MAINCWRSVPLCLFRGSLAGGGDCGRWGPKTHCGREVQIFLTCGSSPNHGIPWIEDDSIFKEACRAWMGSHFCPLIIKKGLKYGHRDRSSERDDMGSPASWCTVLGRARV